MSSMIVKISSNFLKNQLKNKYLVWQQLVMKSALIGIPTEQDQAKYNGNRKKTNKGLSSSISFACESVHSMKSFNHNSVSSVWSQVGQCLSSCRKISDTFHGICNELVINGNF